jgi:diketogulonate reductase-like aldo/keto reductase
MQASQTQPGPSGEVWPALGLGTWRFGEDAAARGGEEAALRLAFDIGYRLIDTAEMYGEGGAETVVGAALAAALRAGLRREDFRIVSKAYPHHADRAGLRAACERSRQRLQIDCIDLYLLHWRGSVPLAQTIDGMAGLQQRGWVRHWGVSNFDVADLEELFAHRGGALCAANQVYYSLAARGAGFDLLPWQQARGVPLMAYSPVDQGALCGHRGLQAFAARHAVSAAQVAIAWLLRQPGVFAIPKAVRAAHLQENWQAQQLSLDAADLAALDRLFPPPAAKAPLAMR